jgi:DNA primase
MPEIDIGRHSEEITHPDEVIFPEIGLTERYVIDYYVRISQWRQPFVGHRFLTLWCSGTC